MGDKTKISWTQSDDGAAGATWNPLTGCTKVSPGCQSCYAESIAERFRGTKAYPNGFSLTLRPDKLDQPLRWTRPRRVFVNSMSDLFHSEVPDGYIAAVWVVMALSPQHTFQVLTKRPGRMRSLLSSVRFRSLMADALTTTVAENTAKKLPGQLPAAWPLPNVWLGTSVEDQRWGDVRVPVLLEVPAVVRFLSCEPLLGPVSLTRWIDHLDWVIVGGESGRGARVMDIAWAEQLRTQCADAGVAYLFKQAGAVLARTWGASKSGSDPAEWPQPYPQEFPRTVE